MAEIVRVKRIANPRRFRKTTIKRNKRGGAVHRTKAGRFRRSAPKRKKSSASPAIRRYPVKTLKKELKRRGVRVSPRATGGKKRRNPRFRRASRKPNPFLIEMINPRKTTSKRRSTVARKRTRKYRRSNSRRRTTAVARVARRRRRSSNPVRRYRRRRASNPVVRRRRRVVHHRRRRSFRRRNPSAFGLGGSNMAIAVGGILAGVAATKYLPTLIPASLTANFGTSPMIGVIITTAGAFAAGWLAHRFVGNRAFGDAVLLGGLAQAGSQLLNVVAPPALSHALALSGMGDIVPGYFPVPQNSVTSRPPMAVAAGGGNGMGLVARRGLYRR